MFQIKNFTNEKQLHEIGVYMITHLKTDIKYIGSTRCKEGFVGRWRSHLQDISKFKGNTVLNNICKKYGIEGFRFSIVEIVNNPEDVRKREAYWIEYYDTYKNGANCTPDTENSLNPDFIERRPYTEEEKIKMRNESPSKKNLYVYDSISGELVFTFQSSVECDRYFGLKKGVSSYAATQRRRICKKYYVSREKFDSYLSQINEIKQIKLDAAKKTAEIRKQKGSYNVTEEQKQKIRKSSKIKLEVDLYDIYGKFIKHFISMNECDDWLEVSRGSTSKVHKGKVKILKKMYIPKIIEQGNTEVSKSITQGDLTL